MEEIRDAVLEALKGSPSGISRDQLSLAVGAEDRTVRRAIEALRNEHYPIGNADRGGYTYGVNEGLKKTIADMRSKALKLFTTAAALENCLTIDGQERFL